MGDGKGADRPAVRAARRGGEDHQDEFDDTVLDRVIPHPAYGPQAWVSVLVPGVGSADQVRALIDHAYRWARRHHKRPE